MGKHDIISEWLLDIKKFSFKDINYFVYRTPISRNIYLLSNFNFNISDFNLKTDDICVAKNRAEMLITNKMYTFDSTVNKLTRFTKSIKKRSTRYLPNMTNAVFGLSDDVNKIDKINYL